ncbi:TPA: type IV conjugative transfer system coupling protein TraD [Shewanella algae]|uniref:type IV conjugative transfer system coupling protein TraD n=1 Tax=Shewanella TaxID=22 RepID=UPI0014313619|nr:MULTISPECIES: type IV conjugative transfer system coupling protein TraD [Shewanella]NJI86971.1 type IV conjugative transfer system coupling protein TraD [Shewanella sp. Iso12]HDS1208465.1 type IV conjugative transfer system coupling protein TraD [Shewanella algae]
MSLDEAPIERLLRPPVELSASLVSGVAAAVSVASPSLWMMTPSVSYMTASVLGAISYSWAVDGLKVVSYQRALRTLKPFSIKPSKTPVSEHASYLGKGFRWTSLHTQRLLDTYKPDNQSYINSSASYDWARRAEVKWEKTIGLSLVSKALRSESIFNPLRPFPDIGGYAPIHGVGVDKENDIYWRLNERPGHCIVLGTTRVGKTRLEELLVSGDIARGDGVVIVIDPKGDGELFRRMYCEAIRAGRENDFYFFHLGYPDDSCRYNPVGEFQRVTEVAGKTTAQLAGDGNSAAFKAFSWRFVNVVAQGLVAIGMRPTVDSINEYVSDVEQLLYLYAIKAFGKLMDDPEEAIKEEAALVPDKNPLVQKKGKSKETVAIFNLMKELLPMDNLGRQLMMAASYDKGFYEKLIANLLPFLEKLNTDKLSKLLSPEYLDPDDARPILSWKDVIQRKGIVYVGLDALSDREVGTAVGNAMFNDLVSTAGLMYKHGQDAGLPSLGGGKFKMPKIYLHADEFNSLVGDEFVPMVNQGGGAGICITAYTQTLQDIDAKFGTTTANPKSMQIIGNFNTTIMLRVQNEETAKLLTTRLPKVPVVDSTAISGTSNTAESGLLNFNSNAQDRINDKEVPLISPYEPQSLPKGQAFVLKEGNQLFKIRIPLLNDKGDIPLPKKVTEVISEMNQKYRSSDPGDMWWENVA